MIFLFKTREASQRGEEEEEGCLPVPGRSVENKGIAFVPIPEEDLAKVPPSLQIRGSLGMKGGCVFAFFFSDCTAGIWYHLGLAQKRKAYKGTARDFLAIFCEP